MSDYIKREDAIEWFQGMLDHDGSDYDIGVGGCIAAAKRRIPSADVAPVRHGRWVYKDEPIFGNPYGRYCCNLCEYGMAYKENYCPNCGARMDGDSNE